MAKQQNGGGPSVVITADQHNATRRQQKAKQKARGGRNHVRTDSYLAGLQEDRRIAREEVVARREFAVYEFRCNQANKAGEHPGITGLTHGTVAYKVAQAMLKAFPLADPFFDENGMKVSRTEASRREALDTLEGDDVLRTEAIQLGVAKARTALHWAYDEIK